MFSTVSKWRSGIDSLESGFAGEDAAVEWLKARGYSIEKRNFRCRTGELDLVARKADILVFVEVKARGPAALSSPAEAVNAGKRARMVKAATWYLARFGSNPPACRFDVIEVLLNPDGEPTINHIPDAFRPGWR